MIGSIGTMLCYFAGIQNIGLSKYQQEAKKELQRGERIRFTLTPHGYDDKITHWHIKHKKSDKTFIVLA